eukprot:TRINITY_DN22841_c0_g1_i4.p3 TRINITY_DN22841_c0_g1~~TRINITY_DN22841_c0_g1_i4.p3  ORF type:complete len:135 (-),score=46.52 TRINITY_DN22841_c0_g1_i4:26-430(-)
MIFVIVFFFFFKQKTAYEMQRGLVGSEMCIRDRYKAYLKMKNYRAYVDKQQQEYQNEIDELDKIPFFGRKLEDYPLHPEEDPSLTKDPGCLYPLEYYDNDDGFWDDYIKKKNQKRIRAHKMPYAPPFYKCTEDF